MSDVPATPGSLLEVLSLLPSGTSVGKLSLEELGRYLSKHYDTEAEKQRNQRHVLRDELFRDGGDRFMREVIKRQFKDPTVRELRENWVPFAKFNNALKRIVNELSTVYAEPAKRSVTGDANNQKYQAALEALWMDEQMLQMSRLLNLHRALLIGVRVRQKPDGTREPVISIATPAIVRAVLHPNDSTEVVGWMIRTNYRTRGLLNTPIGQPPSVEDTNAPVWTLWSATESMHLREDLSVICDSYQTHTLGVIPWVPVSLEPPCAGFWPGNDGEDLVAAHVSIWFMNILQLKETKSATKQVIVKGDGTDTARGQAADSEVPAELADGQSIDTVDMSMDTSMFRDGADHVLEHAAQNYGMPAQVVNHAGVQSAEARELLRLPLKERRKHQQVPLRRFEKRFVVVTSIVLKTDLPELAFDPAGFFMEFGEPETQLSPADEMNLFLSRRAAGLDNTVDFLMRLHPGMTEGQAEEVLAKNIAHEEARTLLMRPAAAANGAAAGGLTNGGGAPAFAPPTSAVVMVPPEEKDKTDAGDAE